MSINRMAAPQFSGYFHLTINPELHDVSDTVELLRMRGVSIEADKFEPISESQLLVEIPDSEDQLLISSVKQDFNPSLQAVQVNHDFADFGEFTRSQLQIKTRQWNG